MYLSSKPREIGLASLRGFKAGLEIFIFEVSAQISCFEVEAIDGPRQCGAWSGVEPHNDTCYDMGAPTIFGSVMTTMVELLDTFP